MAQNTILTDAVIAKESMVAFHNESVFIKNVNKQYSNEFAKTGAKIGQTINVKKANRYSVQQGPGITPQVTTETTVPLTLNRYWTVPLVFSGVERTLDIDKFRKNYITPAITKLASQIDYECHYAAVYGVYPSANAAGSTACPGAGPVNFTIGTPGTTPGTAGGSSAGLLNYNAPTCFLNAGMLLDNMAAPRDNSRSFNLNSAAHAQSVGSLSGLFNPQGLVSDQYKKGLLGNALGFDFMMDQNIAAFTAGTRAASGEITVQAVWTAADAGTIKLTGGSATIKAGDTFTVADCYAVNPETQQSTGILMQFVVTEDVTMSGTTTVKISPTPKVAAAGVADGNVSVAPTNAKAVVWTTGAASGVTPMNLAFHPDAFTFGTADLELPSMSNAGGVSYAGREVFDGISMRVVTFWDGMSDSHITRIDVLGGFSVQRPEWAIRLAG